MRILSYAHTKAVRNQKEEEAITEVYDWILKIRTILQS